YRDLRLLAPALCAGRPDNLPKLRISGTERHSRPDCRCRSPVAARYTLLRALSVAERPDTRAVSVFTDGPEAARVQPDLSERTDIRLLAARIAAGRGFREAGIRACRPPQSGTGCPAEVHRLGRNLFPGKQWRSDSGGTRLALRKWLGTSRKTIP